MKTVSRPIPANAPRQVKSAALSSDFSELAREERVGRSEEPRSVAMKTPTKRQRRGVRAMTIRAMSVRTVGVRAKNVSALIVSAVSICV